MRTTLRKPSPSMGVALIALFIALGGTTYAATGGSFILGQANTAANSSALRSGVTTGSTLNVTNTGGRSAARFTANAGITPFSVSNSTKIGSLNSDLLDGLDSSAFLRTSGKAADANLLDGIDSTGFYAAGSKVADSELLDGYDANQLARAARGSKRKRLEFISVHVACDLRAHSSEKRLCLCKRLGLGFVGRFH
jgi:hypothetical protein